MSRYDLINYHKKLFNKEVNFKSIIKQFENLFAETEYLTLQRHEESCDMFTVRKINGVIVAGNTTYLDSVPAESSFALPTDTSLASFDRLWVFKSSRKLRNYLRILLDNWMQEDLAAGNVDSEAEFYKGLCFWDDSNFYRTGYKHGCAWNDTMENYTFGYRKPKRLMETLTGEKFETWSKAENE